MGALTDAVRRLLDSLQISSASPGHINVVLQTDPGIDLDEALKEAGGDEGKKKEGEIQNTIQKVKNFEGGNVGEVNRFTSAQFGNVRQLARNPVQFMIQAVFRKMTKGVGVVVLALILFEVVKFIISELLKPGRLLDLRFRRNLEEEFLAFRSREEKQALLVGTQSVVITTIGGLRGGQHQISSNLRALAGLQPQPIPRDLQQPNVAQASGQDLKTSKGRGRRNFGRGPG